MLRTLKVSQRIQAIVDKGASRADNTVLSLWVDDAEELERTASKFDWLIRCTPGELHEIADLMTKKGVGLAQVVSERTQHSLAENITGPMPSQTTEVQQAIKQVFDALFPRPREEQLLKVAYDAHIAGDMVKKKQALDVWLDKAFDVSVGSLVEVSGWAQPRQVLLESFNVGWPLDGSIGDGSMRLVGPTDFIGGCAVKMNIISVEQRIWKAQSPTKRMKLIFGDKLPG